MTLRGHKTLLRAVLAATVCQLLVAWCAVSATGTRGLARAAVERAAAPMDALVATRDGVRLATSSPATRDGRAATTAPRPALRVAPSGSSFEALALLARADAPDGVVVEPRARGPPTHG